MYAKNNPFIKHPTSGDDLGVKGERADVEDLSMEFGGAIKCYRVSFSSCQVFQPPAVSQQGLICLQFPSICPLLCL